MVNRGRRQDQIQAPVFTRGLVRVFPFLNLSWNHGENPNRDLVPRIMEKTPITTSFVVPGHIPQLDGLRGLAVLLVLISHSGYLEALPHARMLKHGRFGVDLFFVLSGFL